MNRVRYWDIAKGLAILLVILGHAVELGKQGSDHPLHLFIYSFHMPLFMIISGYLFVQTLSRRTTKDILLKKIIQLLCPVFLFGTIEFFIVRFNPSLSLKENLYFYYGTLVRTLWFLQALFFASMIYLFGERFLKHSRLIYIALMLAFVFTPDLFKSAGTKFLFPCFLFGTCIAHYKWDKCDSKLLTTTFWITCLLFILLLIPFDHSKTIYVHSVFIFSHDAGVLQLLVEDIYRVLLGIAGSVVVLCAIIFLTRFNKPTKIGSLLSTIGKHTLGLYIAHFYLYVWVIAPLSHAFISDSASDIIVISSGFLVLLLASYPAALIIEKGINAIPIPRTHESA